MSGLTLTDVAVRRAQRDIVAGIDLHAQPGQVLGLIGPNGAGKSTLLRAISGSLAISAGQIRFDDADLLTMKRRDRAQLMALVEQDSRAELGITVRQAVDLGRTPHRSLWGMGEDSDDELVEAAMKQVGVETFAARDLETLSGGEQQRVHLARAIAQAPQLLLLDEPTNHLDLAAQAHTLGLMRSLADDGVTVVAALHDLNSAAAVCDQVVVLARGAIQAAGSPAQILTAEIIESTYGVGVDVMTHPRTGRPVITLA